MEIITKTLGDLRIGAPVRVRNLAMFPLFGPTRPEPGYLTLDTALAAGTAEVTEVSETGSVPNLLFVNRGDTPVFLMDGEELVGAKQNRVLNISILADAHSTLKIPVSCVEAGRWNHVSREFQASPRAHFAEGRARRNQQVSEMLPCYREPRADQGEIWRTIHDKAERLSARSATGAMSDIYEKVSTHVEDFVRELKAGEGQTGALFALGGSVSGLDLFDSTDTGEACCRSWCAAMRWMPRRPGDGGGRRRSSCNGCGVVVHRGCTRRGGTSIRGRMARTRGWARGNGRGALCAWNGTSMSAPFHSTREQLRRPADGKGSHGEVVREADKQGGTEGTGQ